MLRMIDYLLYANFCASPQLVLKSSPQSGLLPMYGISNVSSKLEPFVALTLQLLLLTKKYSNMYLPTWHLNEVSPGSTL